MVFPDKEDSIWELDERTGEWYLHHFDKHQPDLNVANPKVRRRDPAESMGFWLELGLRRLPGRRGFPSSSRRSTTWRDPDAAWSTPTTWSRRIRAFLNRRAGHAMMLGEVNLPHAEQLRILRR